MHYLTCKIQHDKEEGLLLHNLGGGGVWGGLVLEFERGGGVVTKRNRLLCFKPAKNRSTSKVCTNQLFIGMPLGM